MIINNDSYACESIIMIINNNIIGTTIVRKLYLNNVKRHKPYILQLLNECGEDKVTKQVLVSFFLLKGIMIKCCVMWFLCM